MEKKTNIDYIGSRFAGEKSGTIEVLLKLMTLEKLDSALTGCYPTANKTLVFHGNFKRISHTFRVETNDWDLISEFAKACEASYALPDIAGDISEETKSLMRLVA